MSNQAGYFAADAEADDELARLQVQATVHDPTTFRHFETIGVTEGWRCLEVGAGAGSVARWLAERVGPTGKVVAADIDPKYLDNLTGPTVDVRRCDITRDDVERDSYDLVHSRLLLNHVTDPVHVLQRMTAAVRPGGWLVAEEPDNSVCAPVDRSHLLAEAWARYNQGFGECLASAGVMDMRFGGILPACMESLGLVEMGTEGIARIFHAGDAYSHMVIQAMQHIDGILLANGVLTESEIADARRAFEDPTFLYREVLMQSVWARKPSQR